MGIKSWFKRYRKVAGENDPISIFHTDHYIRHNARRLGHLASLDLPIAGKSVLEVGAGIGDHTSFYLDRGCSVTVTEARGDNLTVLRSRYYDVHELDLEKPVLDAGPFDICHCYGLLYHLSNPQTALEFMANKTSGMLLLETCVSFGDDVALNPVSEIRESPSQAFSGTGCRPTRTWVFHELKRHFPFVYATITQPNHEEFPTDWSKPIKGLSRSVFVASKQTLESPLLTTSLPVTHSAPS